MNGTVQNSTRPPFVLGRDGCSLCGKTPTIDVAEKHGYHLVRCGRCGLIRAEAAERDDAFDPASYYGADYFEDGSEKFGFFDYKDDAWIERWNCRRHWRSIHRIMPGLTGGAVLDAGCATGAFLGEASPVWRPHGLDVSQYAIALAKQMVPNGEFVSATLDETPWTDASFQLITLWDVLDHLSDPAEAIRRCRRLLVNDGVLVAHVTNIASRFARWCGTGWHLMIPPTHLHYFTPDSIRFALDALGFQVVRIQRPGKWVPLRLIAFRLAYLTPSPLTRWFKRWTTKTALGSIPLYFNFWDVMTVYAVKK